MAEVTVVTRRNGATETHGEERFDLALLDRIGNTNASSRAGARVADPIWQGASLRDARRTAIGPHGARYRLSRSSPFVFVAPFLRVKTVRSATSVNSARYAQVKSALNLLFIVGFPLTFLGRIEGGVPEFLYGVPMSAARLLRIPPVTAMVSIAATIAVVGIWLDGRTGMTARLAHAVVAIGLLSFVAFAWYWRLMPR